MNKETLKKRIYGTFVGCAYGDAMGMPTEMLNAEVIREIYPDGIHCFYPSNEKDFQGRKLEAGEITDDTYNTILVAQMLIDQKGKISAERYIDYLYDWIFKNEEKFLFTAGPSTIRALQAIKKGVSLEKAGITGTTNGAAMKIAPIGIISDYHQMEKLVENVHQICLPTHNTGVAIAGASVIAACVSYGIQGGTEQDELWDIALQAAKSGVKKGYPAVSVSLSRRICELRKLVIEAEDETILKELQDFYGTGTATVETIPAVLAIISIADGNPVKAGEIAAGVGGDTDTLGAIACAICGSMHPDFPSNIVEQLERVNHIDFEYLATGLLPYAKI